MTIIYNLYVLIIYKAYQMFLTSLYLSLSYVSSLYLKRTCVHRHLIKFSFRVQVLLAQLVWKQKCRIY